MVTTRADLKIKEIERLLKAHKDGCSSYWIAYRYGISRTLAQRIIKEHETNEKANTGRASSPDTQG